MLAVAIDQRRHRRPADHIDASACQRESLSRKVDDARRLRDAAVEPRLHGVAVGGGDLERLRRHQRAQMPVDDGLGSPVAGCRRDDEPGRRRSPPASERNRRRKRLPGRPRRGPIQPDCRSDTRAQMGRQGLWRQSFAQRRAQRLRVRALGRKRRIGRDLPLDAPARSPDRARRRHSA